MPVGTAGSPNLNWLDSMDARETRFTMVDGFFTSIGFYMTGPNDAGGNFTINGVDGNAFIESFTNIFPTSQGSGQVYYISISDSEGLGGFSVVTNAGNDGFGIDNVTIGVVPEPATLALLGLGLSRRSAA